MMTATPHISPQPDSGSALEIAENGAPEEKWPEEVEKKGAKSPERRCLVTGESRSREGLIRFVVGPDSQLVPDLKGRLPGRGLWITARRDMIATALDRGLFAKAARARVTADDDLADRLEALLVRRFGDLLGLAMAAGQAAQGFDAIGHWLGNAEGRGDRVGVLLAARDASERGVAKFKGLAPDAPLIRPLGSDEMGQAIGREDATYVAIERGTFSDRLLIEAHRLEGFRKQD